MDVPVGIPVSAPVFEQAAPVVQPVLEQPVMQCTSGTCTIQESRLQSVRNGLAQQKAEVQASQGRMRHIGGSFGAGRFEGVGFSTVSADHAIQQCCYWNQKQPVDIGVARGTDGWYATVLYR